ncbi:hypothetical protein EC957_011627, partial [Mortierella hygrophila]
MTSGDGQACVTVSAATAVIDAVVVASVTIADDYTDYMVVDDEDEPADAAPDDGDADDLTAPVEDNVFDIHLAAATKTTKDLLHAKNTARNYNIYLKGGRQYCVSIGKVGALDTITTTTPLILKAYIASKCERLDQEEREADQEAEREIELLGLTQDGDNGKKASKNNNKSKSKNKMDGSQPKSLSTAETIRAAWKLYYRQTFKVQDGWRVEDGKCIGNPVDDIDLAQNDELHRLQGHMVEGLGINGDDTVFKTQKNGNHYFKIKLTFRKTNQRDSTKYNVYQVHPQRDNPLTCCYSRLSSWLEYLERVGHPLRNEDYVFPTLGARGDIRLHQRVSPDTIQRYLDLFTNEAGLIKDTARARYTTHCFRRGGAQHCFMFKKPQWSLKACKWWGGWSKGAERGAIENYLMDEISAYEESYEDQYSEDRAAYKHTTFMGEEDGDAPSSVGLVQSLRDQVTRLQQQL